MPAVTKLSPEGTLYYRTEGEGGEAKAALENPLQEGKEKEKKKEELLRSAAHNLDLTPL